jgi:hypothetical protein
MPNTLIKTKMLRVSNNNKKNSTMRSSIRESWLAVWWARSCLPDNSVCSTMPP